MRNFTAYLAAPILAASGFRFSKDYRWGTTRIHRIVYAALNTVTANYLADVLSPTARG